MMGAHVLHSRTFILPVTQATKVFLGAHTFFANGHMMAPAGSSVVAMVAKVCCVCATTVFGERVRT